MPCSKGMQKCRRGCLHRRLVLDYRDARFAWEALRESDTFVDTTGAAGALVSCYQLEDREFREKFPAPTFKQWLIDQAGKKVESNIR